MKTLSKSDFILGRSCATKLYFKENGYEMNTADNEFVQYLAEGGYIIGKYAQLMYPDGVLVDTLNKEDAIRQTNELLQQENAIVFEAAIAFEKVFFRADILIKQGNHFHLLEVKAKSYNPTEKFKESEFKKYIEDALFQAIILEKAYPDNYLDVGLLLMDKSRTTAIDHLHDYFSITIEDGRYGAEANFELGSHFHEQLVKDNLLTEFLLNDRLEKERNKLTQAIEALSNLYQDGDCELLRVPINKDCKGCEFRLGKDNDGFSECWGDLGKVEPHLFDLYYQGGLKDQGANHLISNKTVSLYDVTREMVTKQDETMGSRGQRQWVQIENTRKNTEWFDATSLREVTDLPYPLFFIDFETAKSALPPYQGMRPYETIAFQWSCHILRSPDQPLEHHEFISTDKEFPNFKFAEALMNLVGNNRNLFMWATHENTTLKEIREQMDIYGYSNPELAAWLDQIVKFDKKDEGWFIDLNKKTLDAYFNPDMKGRTSIKVTLPAVWNNHSYLHTHSWFDDYLSYDEQGDVQSPYKSLQERIEVVEEVEIVEEGTGAMRAYFEMMFGPYAHKPEVTQSWKDSLLEYCKLDTLSMVVIWHHWYVLTRKE